VTKEEAKIIFKSWQDYIETADKFSKLWLPVPESFLPYPVKLLEEAINIVAEGYFDSGDHKMVKVIHETIGYLAWSTKDGGVMTDEEALNGMKSKLETILRDPELTKALLRNLKASQESWMKSREAATGMPAHATNEREAAEKFFKDHPSAAFDVAMGKRGTLSMTFATAVYAQVCNQLEKGEYSEKVRDLMNSLENMDLSAEAQKRGYRNRDQAVEAGKEIVRARVKAVEEKLHRQANPTVLDQLARQIKKLF
jgi:hypothetical protein